MFSGCINWPRHGEFTWENTGRGSTMVFAYWLGDRQAVGLDVLAEDRPPRDWFVQDDAAFGITGVSLDIDGPEVYSSPNVEHVLTAPGILAVVCLGTATGTYYSRHRDGYWWAGHVDLTRRGRRIVDELNRLYSRTPHLVTYMNVRPMEQEVPEAALDPATVVAVSGHS